MFLFFFLEILSTVHLKILNENEFSIQSNHLSIDAIRLISDNSVNNSVNSLFQFADNFIFFTKRESDDEKNLIKFTTKNFSLKSALKNKNGILIKENEKIHLYCLKKIDEENFQLIFLK